MKKKYFYSSLVILFFITALLLYSIINSNSSAFSIISYSCYIISTLFLLYTVKKVRQFRFDWLMIALSCFSFFCCDLLWAYYSIYTNINPQNVPLVSILYMLPNIFILAAVSHFFLKQKDRWNEVQLLIDVITFIIVNSFLAWVIFFNRFISSINSIGRLCTFISNVIDIIILTTIAVLYISHRAARISKGFKSLILGIIIYSTSDLVYSYMVFNNTYKPNSFIDAAYVISLIVFSVSGLFSVYKPTVFELVNKNRKLPENLGSSNDIISLGIISIVFFFLHYINLFEALCVIGIIFLRYIISNYTKMYFKNKYLLMQQRELNESLENKIYERTRALVNLNAELDMLAKHDPVTDLANRRFFLDELQRMIDEVDKGIRGSLTIFFIDLDRFKSINDSYGHETGDMVLIDVSKKIKGVLKRDSLIARFGGDEFIIAIPDLKTVQEIIKAAEGVISQLDAPVIIGLYQFNITLCLGISTYPYDAKDKTTLLKNADIAMYRAKEAGFNQYKFYNQGMDKEIENKLQMELMLRNADFDKEFELYYQPQVDVSSNRLIGVEALIRWNNPVKGLIPPSEFIPIAEEINIIVQLGEWVIANATKQIKIWNEKYKLNLKVGINVSPKQFYSYNFIKKVSEQIEMYQVLPEWIDIEITEESAMKKETQMEEMIMALANIGVHISIDDFGTGYSSLSYLKRFSVDTLKIAKQLIDSIATDFNDYQIVKAIIMMSKALDLKVIAEGVETWEQLKKLIELGCDEIQGYYYGKPSNSEIFEREFLNNKLCQ